MWNAYRFTYNSCVYELQELSIKIQFTKNEEEKKEIQKQINKLHLRNKLVTVKKNDFFRDKEWLSEIRKTIRQQAVFECFDRFMTCLKMCKNKKIKYFKFKKKKDTYTRTMNLEKSDFKYDKKKGELTILGMKKMRFFKGNTKTRKQLNILESEEQCQMKIQITPTNKYYLIVPIKKEKEKVEKNRGVVSIDPGVKTFYTCYDHSRKECIKMNGDLEKWSKKNDEYISNYEELKKYINKEKDLKKNRKITDIKKRLKDRIKRLNEKIKNKKEEFKHKVTTFLVKNYENIVIPQMEVKKMTKKEDSVLRTKTRRQFLSIGHYMVLEKMKEKSRRYGSNILIVGERYTSKTCGRCGNIKRELRGEEIYKCNKCGIVIDRDINGARNILLRTIGEMALG